MNIEKLKAEHPDVYKAVREEGYVEGAALNQETLKLARIEGAQSERDRISAVRAQTIPGHEALIEQMAFDGKSTAADAALAIVTAEKSLRTGALSNLEVEKGVVVPVVDGDDSNQTKTMKRADFNKLSPADQARTAKSNIKIVD